MAKSINEKLIQKFETRDSVALRTDGTKEDVSRKRSQLRLAGETLGYRVQTEKKGRQVIGTLV